jgi:hypothetical protein
MGGSGKATMRRILPAAEASDLGPELIESLAGLRHAMDSSVAAIKGDLAHWLDQRGSENSTAIWAALIETAFDRLLEERTAKTSDLAAAAADANDMIQPVLRRCVQRRRETLDTTTPPTARDIAATFGVSKTRLYGIAARLDAAGSKDEAHHLRGAADYLEELLDLPDAYDAFMEVMVEWGRQNEPIDDQPESGSLP